jgi:hypothetical protein
MSASESELCPHCGGDGRVYDDGNATPRACVCKLRAMFRVRVGDEVFGAERLKGATRLDAARNLTFRADWKSALPHMRQALLGAWGLTPEHRHVVTTDLRIVDASLSEGADGIESLVGPQHHLVIVRLGFLPSKNAAAADALLSTLRHRAEIWRAPVWVTDTPDVPFVRGHFAWSEAVKRFLEKHLEEVIL